MQRSPGRRPWQSPVQFRLTRPLRRQQTAAHRSQPSRNLEDAAHFAAAPSTLFTTDTSFATGPLTDRSNMLRRLSPVGAFLAGADRSIRTEEFHFLGDDIVQYLLKLLQRARHVGSIHNPVVIVDADVHRSILGDRTVV